MISTLASSNRSTKIDASSSQWAVTASASSVLSPGAPLEKKVHIRRLSSEHFNCNQLRMHVLVACPAIETIFQQINKSREGNALLHTMVFSPRTMQDNETALSPVLHGDDDSPFNSSSATCQLNYFQKYLTELLLWRQHPETRSVATQVYARALSVQYAN